MKDVFYAVKLAAAVIGAGYIVYYWGPSFWPCVGAIAWASCWVSE